MVNPDVNGNKLWPGGCISPVLPDFKGETGLMSPAVPDETGNTGLTGFTGDTPSAAGLVDIEVLSRSDVVKMEGDKVGGWFSPDGRIPGEVKLVIALQLKCIVGKVPFKE